MVRKNLPLLSSFLRFNMKCSELGPPLITKAGSAPAGVFNYVDTLLALSVSHGAPDSGKAKMVVKEEALNICSPSKMVRLFVCACFILLVFCLWALSNSATTPTHSHPTPLIPTQPDSPSSTENNAPLTPTHSHPPKITHTHSK